MKSKMQVAVAAVLIAIIGGFGVIESLQAAPKESQRLRGMEGRAFLVEGFLLDEFGDVIGENPPGGSYCYFFNSDAEWIDERWIGGPGTWEQDSVGAATSYTGSAAVEVEPGVFVALDQQGHVTPAKGRGVLQLEAVTDVLLLIYDEDENLLEEILLFQLLTVGHEDPDCGSEPG